MSPRLIVSLITAGLYLAGVAAPAYANDVDETTPLGQSVERHLGTDGPVQQWVQDPERIVSRAGRKDPTLRGHLVLQLTIEPDGSVSVCTLYSSDMDEPFLADQVVTPGDYF